MIRSMHESGKEETPYKVGKFGLGFKSVYHLTGKLIGIVNSYEETFYYKIQENGIDSAVLGKVTIKLIGY